eukprot:GCRY01001456.1.p1 GENE.GCRY01001456.1~~GCRY01001456.1.p1  ORF type:complete len:1025 (-),score=253.77 GCRY01001456.1:129-3125(-)
MNDSHSREASEILKFFGTSENSGLTPQQVQKNADLYGRNELPPEEKTPMWKLILQQFEDQMVIILLFAAVVSFVLAFFEAEEDQLSAFVESLVIVLILAANATIGVIQESNAEKAIEALKAYEPEIANVLRNGKITRIKAQELVPGDIVEVAVGARVPADLRLISLLSTNMRVDQAPLTGESNTVTKVTDVVRTTEAVVQDKKNMLFSGTTVSIGRGRAIVVQTGSQTEIGKIRRSITSAEDVVTPLKKKLDEFGILLSKLITVICILVWVININHFADPSHGSWLRGAVYYFKIAVALAVAAIPEGLPAVVTTCLALGTMKMAKKNAIVRSLPSVETLGCTTVICSDKTGTLTTNNMSVQKVLVADSVASADELNLKEWTVEGTTYDPRGTISVSDSQKAPNLRSDKGLVTLSQIATLCNDASLSFNAERGVFEISGEATEAALKVLSEKIGSPNANRTQPLSNDELAHFYAKHWESVLKKIVTLEFTRDRKSMSVVVKENNGQEHLFVKGAPEHILSRCRSLRCNITGEDVALSDAYRDQLIHQLEQYGTGADTLRCLALAVKENISPEDYQHLKGPEDFARVESEMTLIGFVGMLDPPRVEVTDAIRECRESGIRVIVITGDNKATAESICKKIGVFDRFEDLKGKSYTGREFDALSEAEKVVAVNSASLFARVEPAHKQKLVEILQNQHHVVAMTGDGVNDAPALKKADIGVAMGTGTAVAKGAAEMVLADDNFATIVNAVEEGRAIYNNTKQFIRFLISSNIGEVVSIFLTAALGMPEALVPVQLLWVNLVTDGLPATALGFNPPDADIMQKPPRSSREPIINGWMFFRYLLIGFYVGAATVGGAAWWYMYYEHGPRVTFAELTNFHSCVDSPALGYSCSVFTEEIRPSTVALTILVTIEMFNALNSLSEDQSMFVMHPLKNLWLVGAVALSFVLHLAILYIPWLSAIFGVAPLTLVEWEAVIYLSLPVIFIDEVMKFISRIRQKKTALQKTA